MKATSIRPVRCAIYTRWYLLTAGTHTGDHEARVDLT
jgi:hypothetical protein